MVKKNKFNSMHTGAAIGILTLKRTGNWGSVSRLPACILTNKVFSVLIKEAQR